MIAEYNLLTEVMHTYGDVTTVRCLAEYWHEWGGLPPMTIGEARKAIADIDRARSLGMLPADFFCLRQVVRDVVLVRRGVNLCNHFTAESRRKLVTVRYATDERAPYVNSDSWEEEETESRDLTEEIVRVALELL